MIPITPHLALDENELHEEFIRSSGAGGQNVNKVATAVQLRFDVEHSPSLPNEVRERLKQLVGKRLTQEGILVIKAQSFRTQEKNREDALARLVELVREAAKRPVVRRPTKPTRASQQRRLESKSRQSQLKRQRRSMGEGD